MATSEVALQIFGGTKPHLFGANICLSSSGSGFSSISFCRKKRGSKYIKSFKCIGPNHHSIRIHPSKNGISHRYSTTQKSRFLNCKCQHSESVGGITAEGENRTWFVDNAKGFDSVNGNIPDALRLETAKELNPKRELYNSNGNSASSGATQVLGKSKASSIEDEAWELLRESMVYYCGSPIGTIAANDPTSSSVLNYDQVFIRDFIPSGIAFLLKGEYEIVRNFILHTLQLQVNMIIWCMY